MQFIFRISTCEAVSSIFTHKSDIYREWHSQIKRHDDIYTYN